MFNEQYMYSTALENVFTLIALFWTRMPQMKGNIGPYGGPQVQNTPLIWVHPPNENTPHKYKSTTPKYDDLLTSPQ